MMSTRSRSRTVVMACIPLTARLMITCCSWTRSPRTGSRLESSSSCIATPCRSASYCRSVTASSTTSLMSSRIISGPAFFRELANPANYLAGAMRVLYDLPDTDDCLFDIRRLTAQPPQAAFCVSHDGGERLVHLMRDRRAHLSERAHARDVGG